MKIDEFFPIIKDDLSFLATNKLGWGASNEVKQKVALAALRTLAALGMALSTAVGVSFLFSLPFSPVVSLIQLGVTTLAFSVCYDLFVISKNGTDQMGKVQKVAAQVQGFVANVKDVFDHLVGKKQTGSAPHKPLTTGTIWESVWNKILVNF
jgi:hypothetical protein